MFNITDRKIVGITIGFNITTILDWLKLGGKFEDIDKIKREKFDSLGEGMIQEYRIDMFPVGKQSNAYYHRKKGLISSNISGVDCLDNIDEEIKFFLKKFEIQSLQWCLQDGSLLLMIEGKESREIIFATPSLTEVVELETKGKLINRGSLREVEKKIKVIVSRNEDANLKESLEIFRSVSTRSVSYSNALGYASFSVQNPVIEY